MIQYAITLAVPFCSKLHKCNIIIGSSNYMITIKVYTFYRFSRFFSLLNFISLKKLGVKPVTFLN